MKNKLPQRFLHKAEMGPDGRIISYLHCPKHPCTDKIRWPDGSEECLFCARERQIKMMTPKQKKNVGFHLPPYWEWQQKAKS